MKKQFFNIKRIEKITFILKRYLKKSGVKWMLDNQDFVKIWQQTVGEEIAQKTKVSGFNKGILYIEVESSVLRLELEQFYMNSLIISINKNTPAIGLRKIKFKIADFIGEEK